MLCRVEEGTAIVRRHRNRAAAEAAFTQMVADLFAASVSILMGIERILLLALVVLRRCRNKSVVDGVPSKYVLDAGIE